jgi:hypothetical protein
MIASRIDRLRESLSFFMCQSRLSAKCEVAETSSCCSDVGGPDGGGERTTSRRGTCG